MPPKCRERGFDPRCRRERTVPSAQIPDVRSKDCRGTPADSRPRIAPCSNAIRYIRRPRSPKQRRDPHAYLTTDLLQSSREHTNEMDLRKPATTSLHALRPKPM